MNTGAEPSELAPKFSAATRLLHEYELHRAQQLSAAALGRAGMVFNVDVDDRCVVSELFTDVGDNFNSIPSVLPGSAVGVITLQHGNLAFGILEAVTPKRGW